MTPEHTPTAQQLLISWQLIWNRVLNGDEALVKDAINTHVQLFPKGNHAEVRRRTERQVACQRSQPEVVKSLLARGKARLQRL